MPTRLIAGAGLAAVLMAATTSAALASPSGVDPAIKRCLALADDKARLRCFEGLTAREPAAPPAAVPLPAPSPRLPGATSTSRSQSVGNWRLVRTPNPEGGKKDAVAIMRNAELSGSDIDFAGLMFRCAEPEIEALAVVVRPLPPRARPRIAIAGTVFTGTVLPPGAAILLPPEAMSLARADWKNRPTLSIEVTGDEKTVKGQVAMEGFDNAIQTLNAHCASQ
jgi:hypothetical protein